MSGHFALAAMLAVTVVVGFAVLGSTSCDAAEPTAKVDAVVDGNTAFALHLYAKLRTDNKENVFLSPYSISTALAMTYAGAKGKTASEMAEVLHFAGPQDEIAPAFSALTAKLHGDVAKEGYELRIANRLWGQNGYKFLPAFLKITRDDFGAELAQLDFAGNAETARRTINKWVEEKTADKIKDLIGPGVLGPSTTLVLTNAIYFKGEWLCKFEVRATHDMPFQITKEQKATVPMMRQTATFGYGEFGDVQVLEMPYRGRNVSMFVLLPKDVDGLAALEKNLSEKSLKTMTTGLERQQVEVFLPKFKTTSSFEMSKTLAAMGMPQAFSSGADFSGMTGNRELFISAVVHKAFVDVTEEGTEAAAATGIVMARSARPQSHPIFRADRPFLFLIRDTRTGSVLFLGRLVNPKG
jgi:serine protease inhibitor